jgi:hypothetical protein
MSQAYDTRPELEGYDALTVRGIAKWTALVALAFGAQALADHYGLAFWFHGAINLFKAGLGAWVMWLGVKALVTGDGLADADLDGPRYAEPDRIAFISPRVAAAGQIHAGAAVIAEAALHMSQFLPE